MKAARGPQRLTRGRSAAGFSLIEFMVAITIGLFIAIALGAIFLNAKSAFLSQGGLASLQDSERLVLSILTTEVQLAGYFPDPTVNSATTDLLADVAVQSYGQFSAGQGIAGVVGTGPGGDTFATRYMSANNDGLLNCQGGVNSSGAGLQVTNVFSISANNELQCAVIFPNVASSPPVALASNVQSMKVLYGVDTVGGGSVTQYLNATQVTNGSLWASVKSVQVTLVFLNPFSVTQVGASTPTIQWVQNIGVMGAL